MSITGFDHIITDSEFKRLIHPTETSRFILALFAAILVTLAIIALTVLTQGMALIFILILIASVWFGLQILKAALMGNSVKVSPDNFPDVHEVLAEVKYRLNYHGDVEIYITEGGSFNAFLYKFFQTKFILLNSDIVSGLPVDNKRAELVWIVARFVGALKAKHARLQLLSLIINSVEQLHIFNLFILPYQRATQLSGDIIGLAVCGDLDSGINALGKLMVGKDLGNRVRLKGMLNQSYQSHRSFFAMLAKLISSYPHMTDRYLSLLGFARSQYPNEFTRYAARFDDIRISEIDGLLPGYYAGTQPAPLKTASSVTGLQANDSHISAQAHAMLIGIEGPVIGKRINIQKSIFKIGSAPENDLVMAEDDFASSSHAWICTKGENLIVVDQNSKNGTMLNNEQISPEGVQLKHGDHILIGLSTFELKYTQ